MGAALGNAPSNARRGSQRRIKAFAVQVARAVVLHAAQGKAR
jgi:hypothetical protein